MLTTLMLTALVIEYSSVTSTANPLFNIRINHNTTQAIPPHWTTLYITNPPHKITTRLFVREFNGISAKERTMPMKSNHSIDLLSRTTFPFRKYFFNGIKVKERKEQRISTKFSKKIIFSTRLIKSNKTTIKEKYRYILMNNTNKSTGEQSLQYNKDMVTFEPGAGITSDFNSKIKENRRVYYKIFFTTRGTGKTVKETAKITCGTKKNGGMQYLSATSHMYLMIKTSDAKDIEGKRLWLKKYSTKIPGQKAITGELVYGLKPSDGYWIPFGIVERIILPTATKQNPTTPARHSEVALEVTLPANNDKVQYLKTNSHVSKQKQTTKSVENEKVTLPANNDKLQYPKTKSHILKQKPTTKSVGNQISKKLQSTKNHVKNPILEFVEFLKKYSTASIPKAKSTATRLKIYPSIMQYKKTNMSKASIYLSKKEKSAMPRPTNINKENNILMTHISKTKIRNYSKHVLQVTHPALNQKLQYLKTKTRVSKQNLTSIPVGNKISKPSKLTKNHVDPILEFVEFLNKYSTTSINEKFQYLKTKTRASKQNLTSIQVGNKISKPSKLTKNHVNPILEFVEISKKLQSTKNHLKNPILEFVDFLKKYSTTSIPKAKSTVTRLKMYPSIMQYMKTSISKASIYLSKKEKSAMPRPTNINKENNILMTHTSKTKIRNYSKRALQVTHPALNEKLQYLKTKTRVSKQNLTSIPVGNKISKPSKLTKNRVNPILEFVEFLNKYSTTSIPKAKSANDSKSTNQRTITKIVDKYTTSTPELNTKSSKTSKPSTVLKKISTKPLKPKTPVNYYTKYSSMAKTTKTFMRKFSTIQKQSKIDLIHRATTRHTTKKITTKVVPHKTGPITSSFFTVKTTGIKKPTRVPQVSVTKTVMTKKTSIKSKLAKQTTRPISKQNSLITINNRNHSSENKEFLKPYSKIMSSTLKILPKPFTTRPLHHFVTITTAMNEINMTKKNQITSKSVVSKRHLVTSKVTKLNGEEENIETNMQIKYSTPAIPSTVKSTVAKNMNVSEKHKNPLLDFLEFLKTYSFTTLPSSTHKMNSKPTSRLPFNHVVSIETSTYEPKQTFATIMETDMNLTAKSNTITSTSIKLTRRFTDKPNDKKKQTDKPKDKQTSTVNSNNTQKQTDVSKVTVSANTTSKPILTQKIKTSTFNLPTEQIVTTQARNRTEKPVDLTQKLQVTKEYTTTHICNCTVIIVYQCNHTDHNKLLEPQDKKTLTTEHIDAMVEKQNTMTSKGLVTNIFVENQNVTTTKIPLKYSNKTSIHITLPLDTTENNNIPLKNTKQTTKTIATQITQSKISTTKRFTTLAIETNRHIDQVQTTKTYSKSLKTQKPSTTSKALKTLTTKTKYATKKQSMKHIFTETSVNTKVTKTSAKTAFLTKIKPVTHLYKSSDMKEVNIYRTTNKKFSTPSKSKKIQFYIFKDLTGYLSTYSTSSKLHTTRKQTLKKMYTESAVKTKILTKITLPTKNQQMSTKNTKYQNIKSKTTPFNPFKKLIDFLSTYSTSSRPHTKNKNTLQKIYTESAVKTKSLTKITLQTKNQSMSTKYSKIYSTTNKKSSIPSKSKTTLFNPLKKFIDYLSTYSISSRYLTTNTQTLHRIFTKSPINTKVTVTAMTKYPTNKKPTKHLFTKSALNTKVTKHLSRTKNKFSKAVTRIPYDPFKKFKDFLSTYSTPKQHTTRNRGAYHNMRRFITNKNVQKSTTIEGFEHLITNEIVNKLSKTIRSSSPKLKDSTKSKQLVKLKYILSEALTSKPESRIIKGFLSGLRPINTYS